MNAFAIIMLASPILLIAVLVLLALIAAGIRRADRASLHSTSRSRLSAIASRVVGGFRDSTGNDEDR
jgi:hypothetical protein